MEYKRRILKLLDEIGDDEIVFHRQIYTIKIGKAVNAFP